MPTLSINLLTRAMLALVTADSALSIPSWTGMFDVAVLAAISFAPVMVAWVVGGRLVRRAVRRRHASSLTPATR